MPNIIQKCYINGEFLSSSPNLPSAIISQFIWFNKLLNNNLFLNKMLFKFRIVSRSLWSFCNSEEETPSHIFHDCTHTQNLWNQLQTYISQNLVISCLTPQSAMFGFIDTRQGNCVIINHLLLIFKFSVYKSRDLKTLNFLRLKSDIIKIRHIEENLYRNDIQK